MNKDKTPSQQTFASEPDSSFADLLSSYADPTPDNGFSDKVMARIQTQNQTFNIADYAPAPRSTWRSWVIALMLGLIGGMLWVRLGVTLPDLPDAADVPNLLDQGWVSQGWAIYAVCGIMMGGLMLFIQAEA